MSTGAPVTVPLDAPERLCDVVMKGGITSGVVYPSAVTELATTYRLKSVGGASAGAIAAAVAAAAEYGRSQDGYAVLADLSTWLGTKGNLRGLFQAQRETRSLNALLMASIGRHGSGRARGVAAAALRAFPGHVALGSVLGLALLAGVLAGDAGGVSLVAGVLAAVVVLVLGVAVAVMAGIKRTAQSALGANFFGICSGMPGTDPAQPALTPWLMERIEDAARRGAGPGEPLTFGHLWAGPGRDPADARPDEPWLRLEMMTTNVTNHRAERLPTDSREYFFSPEEFRRLFPEPVVTWMVDHPPPLGSQPDSALRRHLALPLRPMPYAADLPVIVATRMSLSFPVLLSAVPLWRVDFSRRHNQEAKAAWSEWLKDHEHDWEEVLEDADAPGLPATRIEYERCWFSDGGIASNFPVHFFDSYLPRHPTFAINLRPFHPDTLPPPGREPSLDDAVLLPESHRDERLDWWYRFDGKPAKFLANIVRTMQNRVDDAQMRVPGYRDRVVHVSLTESEGGMNLDMEPETIRALVERGQRAGERLVQRFAHPPLRPNALSWDDHRWVRLRTAMASTAQMIGELKDQFAATPPAGERSYAQLLARPSSAPPTSYPVTQAERALAEKLLDGVGDIADELDASAADLQTRIPSPPPRARIVPEDPPIRPR